MNHGWKYKRLGEVTTIKSGYTPSQSDLHSYGEFPYFKVAEMNLPGNEKYLIKTPSYLSGDIKTFPENSIVFPKNGAAVSTNKKRILKVTSVVDLNTAVMLCDSYVDYRYIYYSIVNIDFTKLVKRGAVPTLNIFELKQKFIPVPSLEIQTRIVLELDKINELIGVKRSQLADLDLLAQSLFYEMFGDPIDNPKGWNLYNLGDCVEFKNGLNFTPSDNGNEIKCLGVGNFKSNRYISDESLPSINIVELVSKEYLLEDGDIVFVRSNGNKALIGRSILYTSKGAEVTFSGFCIRCRYSNEKYNPLYMAYLLSSKTIRHYMTSQGKGCNISNINQKILSAMPFLVPPIELQNQFAAKIKAIEEQKRLTESSITDLQTLLASRMDYWFND